MSLAERRLNAPQSLGPIPVFQLQTPNRSVRRILSRDSFDTLASQTTQETLPEYDLALEDENPDIITTSIEIDPDQDDDDVDLTPRPKKIIVTKPRKVTRKRSGLAKLFSRSSLGQDLPSPGVRLTRAPRYLKTRTKDFRNGFPINPPTCDGEAILDMDPIVWMRAISRINILLLDGQTDEIQGLISSIDAIKDRVSFVKLVLAKENGCKALDDHELPLMDRLISHSAPHSLLTVPELAPTNDESDDDASSFISGRRSSVASSCSSVSTRSSLSQRIRTRFEKKEEWCLMLE